MPDRMVMAVELKAGDLMNLEDDKYADPDGTNQTFPYEYVVVDRVVIESKECVRVETEVDHFGFPPDHLIKVHA